MNNLQFSFHNMLFAFGLSSHAGPSVHITLCPSSAWLICTTIKRLYFGGGSPDILGISPMHPSTYWYSIHWNISGHFHLTTS